MTALRRPAGIKVEQTPAPPQVRVPESVPAVGKKPRPESANRWRQRIIWIGLSFAPSMHP